MLTDRWRGKLTSIIDRDASEAYGPDPDKEDGGKRFPYHILTAINLRSNFELVRLGTGFRSRRLESIAIVSIFAAKMTARFVTDQNVGRVRQEVEMVEVFW